jgi:hypothetical protein
MADRTNWRIWLGLLAGVCFGLVDAGAMLLNAMPARALLGAFASRFAIGFLIPQVSLPMPRWLSGVLVALLVSTPDAIITGSYLPIYLTAVFGGLLIGVLTAWQERRREHVLEHGLM